MKLRLLDLLACPTSGGPVKLEVLRTQPGPPVDVPRVMCRDFCARLGSSPAEATVATCAACYGEEIVEGFLWTEDGLVLPILDGVPRLIANAMEEYPIFFLRHRERIREVLIRNDVSLAQIEVDPAHVDPRSGESFGLQWEVYKPGDRTWFKDDMTLRKEELLRSLDVSADELDRKLLLDAGCGNGRLTARAADYGLEVVGMDLSRSVERAEKEKGRIAGSRAPFVHFLQGNVVEAPFRDGSFDYVHCSGVLVAVPDHRQGFRSLKRVTRPEGKVFIQVYRKRPLWITVINSAIRSVSTHLPLRLLMILCYLLTPVHLLGTHLMALLRREWPPPRATIRERAVVMFDNYSPPYQHRFWPEEVEKLFLAEGLESPKDVTLENEARHCISFVGIKPVAEREKVGV